MKALTVAQMRKAEQLAFEGGATPLQLMKQAGHACASFLLNRHKLISQPVVILCGKGNNGGDGFVIAEYLHRRGADVTVVLCQGNPKTEPAKDAFADIELTVPILQIGQSQTVRERLQEATLIVDAIFGIGFTGELPAPLASFFTLIESLGCPVYAIDIPSGLSGDHREPTTSFLRPTITLALGAYKKVHRPSITPAPCGEVLLLDVGIDARFIREAGFELISIDKDLAAKLLPKRNPHTNKSDYGKLLLVAGSVGMSGAAMMATKAALRSGSGITILATPQQTAGMVAPMMMEAMTIPLPQNQSGSLSGSCLPMLQQLCQNSSALVLGCGLGHNNETADMVCKLIEGCDIPILLDADGINAVCRDITMVKRLKNPVIMTPHPGEFARMMGLTVAEVEADRATLAAEAAETLGIILVLKGHETIVALPNGVVFCNTTGNAGLAKGGSGDVLAGIIGGLLAQHHLSPETATVLGVYLHGLAADYCGVRYSQYSMTATDIIEALPLVFKQTEAATADPEAYFSQF